MQNSVHVYKIHPDAILPSRQEGEAAGYDLCAIEDFTLCPGESIVVGTGLVVRPPPGYHTEIIIRSGIAYKHNIMLRNGVGIIDRSYAGPMDEVKLLLYRAPELVPRGNSAHALAEYAHSHSPVGFKAGDRIAQMVFRKTHTFEILELAEAPKADDRGGLGSTGV